MVRRQEGERMHRVVDLTRRQLAALLLAAPAIAQTRRDVLSIGLSISDTVTFDPARQANYSPPLTLAAVYDTLVTYVPGSYTGVVPSLASGWERILDGQGLRFTLRPDVVFANGAPVTAADWAFSLNRLRAIGDQPAQFLDAVSSVTAPGPATLDICLKTADAPILGILASPSYAVLEERVLRRHGGTDEPGADRADRATEWLNQNSAGTGPYVLTRWARNQVVELAANPRSWRGAPGFRRVTILHMADAAAQVRALRRGEIDVAFNLIPEQIVSLQSDRGMRAESVTSLDFVYLALNGDKSLNPALATQKARQAIGYAIDYDGILGRLLGGKAVRPASFLPIGVRGSTEAVARTIGFRQDLDQARALLQEAELGDGFTFELSYADGAIAGLAMSTLAQKLRTDLGRVGIKATLQPLDPAAMRTRYLGGRAQASLQFWTQPVVETRSWAVASLQRVARRVGFEPPAALTNLVERAGTEADGPRQQALWVEYQQAMVEQAHVIVLFQPIYQVAMRDTVSALRLTAAGWMADLGGARPG